MAEEELGMRKTGMILLVGWDQMERINRLAVVAALFVELPRIGVVLSNGSILLLFEQKKRSTYEWW